MVSRVNYEVKIALCFIQSGLENLRVSGSNKKGQLL